VIHHWHVAIVLDDPGGWHAVVFGMVLMPLSFLLLGLFLRYQKKIYVWTLLLICLAAIVVPGLYHGGWHHVVKLLKSVYAGSDSSGIEALLPAGDYHLWFYEVSGVVEFIAAIVASYFFVRYLFSTKVVP